MTLVTKEALEAAPSIERTVFDDLVTGVVQVMDTKLLTSTGSLVDNVSPVTGSTSAAEDMRALIADFAGDLQRSVVVLRPDLAAAIAGDGVGRELGVRGGSIMGLPALISRNAPAGSVTLIDGSGVLVAFDEAVQLGVSQQGAVQADNQPTNAATDLGSPDDATGTSVVSLFQTNCFGFRAIASAGWTVAREGAVSVLTGADWANTGSPE